MQAANESSNHRTHGRGMRLGRGFAAFAAGAAILALQGCASTQSRIVEQYIGGPLARPDRILVYDFAYSPGQVKLDRGISPGIARAANGSPRTAKQLEVGRRVAAVLAEQLVKEIRGMGLPARRASGDPSPYGHTVSIEGQFVSIDEGNRTERVVIGLGMGRTTVETHFQVYRDSIDGRLVLERLDTSAKSGRKPGMAVTMGAGAAMGNLVIAAAVSSGSALAAEAFAANVEADARRTAKDVATKLRPFFAEIGWVAPQN